MWNFSPYGPLATELFDPPGWTLLGFAPDIHLPEGAHLLAGPPEGSRWWTADIETNYERKSRLKGHPILVAGFRWSGQEAS